MTATQIVEISGETSVVTAGIQGPAGPPGENIIGGYTVTINSLANNVMLIFNSSAGEWRNIELVQLTDGGNF